MNCEFRQVLPSEYKLFQTADLLCTLTLIEQKLRDGKKLSWSEKNFFKSEGSLRKTFLKALCRIKLGVKKLKINY